MLKILVVGVIVLSLSTAIAFLFNLPPELGLPPTIIALETARRFVPLDKKSSD